jgi:hypothetical protein
MQFINKIRAAVHNYFLKRELEGQSVPRQVMNYNTARHIGILFDASIPENIEEVRKYAQRLKVPGKAVEVIGLFRNKKQVGETVIDHFTMADVNWYHVPDPKVADGIIQKPFDLLISLLTEESLPLEYLSAKSKARFRIGRFLPDKQYCYDLMVYEPAGVELNKLIKQVDHLLTEINKNATV